jgi:hypothetical protein
MIYKKQSVSDDYFRLMLEEALKRDLDCKLIAKEILNFQKFISGSSAPNPITADSSTSPPTEIVHPVTGRTPK